MKNFKRITVLCIIAFLFGWAVYSCEARQRERALANVNLEAARDSVVHFKNRLGIETASRKALLLDYGQMENLYLKADAQNRAMAKEFAKVQSVVKVKTVTRIDTVRITFRDSIPCDFERSGRVAEKWFGLKYKVNPHGIILDSLTVPVTATIMTGTKRKWIFGKQTLTTDITIDNPYVKVQGLESAQLAIPDPWYKKWYVWLAAGFAGGLLLK